MTALPDNLEGDGIAEIVALHQIFDAWLSGRSRSDGVALEAMEAALAPGFSMVPPNGHRLGRDAVIAWLGSAHGSRGPDFRIWIEQAALITQHGDSAIFTYDECQHVDGKDTRRKATVVFGLSPGGERKLHWLAVHETWVT